MFGRILLAFVTALTVSIATQNHLRRCIVKLGRDDAKNVGIVKLSCLLSQVAALLTLFVFRDRIEMLISAGVGLLVPKNYLIIRSYLAKARK